MEIDPSFDIDPLQRQRSSQLNMRRTSSFETPKKSDRLLDDYMLDPIKLTKIQSTENHIHKIRIQKMLKNKRNRLLSSAEELAKK